MQIITKTQQKVYLSAAMGIDRHTLQFVSDDSGLQCKQAMTFLGTLLKNANSDYSKLIKANVYYTDIQNEQSIRDAYEDFFNQMNIEPFPGTFKLIKQLPKNAKVEIEFEAIVKE